LSLNGRTIRTLTAHSAGAIASILSNPFKSLPETKSSPSKPSRVIFSIPITGIKSKPMESFFSQYILLFYYSKKNIFNNHFIFVFSSLTIISFFKILP
jgi:hypothetical protein